MEKIKQINVVLKEFFGNPSNPRSIQAKYAMDIFIKNGIFPSDHRNGRPIRELLRKLDKISQLSLIPFVRAERKEANTYWYFDAQDSFKIDSQPKKLESQRKQEKKQMTIPEKC